MYMRHQVFAVSVMAFACATTAFAAKPIDLRHQPVSVLQSFASSPASPVSIREVSRHVDFNHTTHIRVQQMYAGHPVWSANAVVHVLGNDTVSLSHLSSTTTMNGKIFQELHEDLRGVPAFALSSSQAERAFAEAVMQYQKKSGIAKYDASRASKTLIVFVDKDNKAHWAYLIKFLAGSANGLPAVPTFIVDADHFEIYAEWNDLQTVADVSGGGSGGNPKMGKLAYDGATGHYPILKMKRDAQKKICYLKNNDVVVKDDNFAMGPFFSKDAEFKCDAGDPKHGNLYWDGEQDSVNEGYSPVNDSLYIGSVIKNMYMEWYGVPVLTQFGSPMKLVMHAHATDFFGQVMDNAFFLPLNSEMYFGDGIEMFYPLTSLGVGAHELSHGFTSQHSNLTYEKQSGGMNEAYSDMAAQAAEYYSLGKNGWQIGPEIVKGEGALRYMDDPTKDGKSIDHVKNYTDELNVHHSSGVFNKAFYLLSTSKNWNTRKAFDIMVKANMDYWTADSTFADAACGVVSAAQDYKYNTAGVLSAFKKVGIDASQC